MILIKVIVLIFSLAVMVAIAYVIYITIDGVRDKKERAEKYKSSLERERVKKEVYNAIIETLGTDEITEKWLKLHNYNWNRYTLNEKIIKEREDLWQVLIQNRKEQEQSEVLLTNSSGMDIHVEGQCSITAKPRTDKRT